MTFWCVVRRYLDRAFSPGYVAEATFLTLIPGPVNASLLLQNQCGLLRATLRPISQYAASGQYLVYCHGDVQTTIVVHF